jgi:hypothetical protein
MLDGPTEAWKGPRKNAAGTVVPAETITYNLIIPRRSSSGA